MPLAALLETGVGLHYNLHVSHARVSGHFALLVLCAPLVVGACEKKPNKPVDTGAVTALENAGSSATGSQTAEGAVDTTPLPGIDVSKFNADKAQVFYKLVGSLKSPCG